MKVQSMSGRKISATSLVRIET